MYSFPKECLSRRLVWAPPRERRAFAIIYFLLMWIALIGFLSLAVDFGRVCLAKLQLQDTADAAAHAALSTLSSSGVTAARTAAVTVAAGNTVDGVSVVINPNTNVTFGTWNPVAQTFTALSGAAASSANSVQVTASRTAAQGNGIPLLFASTLGVLTCNVHATSTVCEASNVTLVNSSFESPALPSDGYVYDEPMSGWTLTGDACLETYGSAWDSPQPNGNQSMALQGVANGIGTISQSFSAVEGTYTVSFIGAQRSYYNGPTPVQPVSVQIDGTQVALISPTTASFLTYTTPSFTLTSGTHTLSMSSTYTSPSVDATTFVDTVAINCVGAPIVLAQ